MNISEIKSAPAHIRRATRPTWLLLLFATLLGVATVTPRGIYAQGEDEDEGETTSLIHGAALNCDIAFSDVTPADYFYEAVHALACQGVIGGYSDGTFRPQNNATRAQLSKIIVTAKGWPLVDPPEPTFPDVPRSNPFYGYIETARAQNMVGGYSDGTFRPNANVTRAQLTKIVAGAQGWPLLNPLTASFSDVAVGSAFYSYIETAVANGAIGGYSDGTFRPQNSATRGQIAKIVYYSLSGIQPPPSPTTVVLPTATPQPPQPTQPPAPTSTPQPSQLDQLERQTIEIINSRRAALGIGRLTANVSLNAASRRHSSDIGPRGLCQHNGTDGSSPWDRAAQAGYTGFAMGEVIGCNYPTAQGVVDAWWNSPAHKAILVDPTARDIGCGWWLKPDGYGWQTCLTGTSVVE